jgi:hypothetical protein
MSSDPKRLFPESEFVFVPDVAIFKTHERVKNGKKIKITKKELETIAANHTDKFNRLGIALPSSEGHTLDSADGSDVPEKNQPDITGWFVNYRVAKLPSDPDEDYLIADWYVRKDKSYVIRDFPTRSVELYPSKMELWPVANLKSSCPELDLPIIKYSQETRPDEEPVQLTLTLPVSYSLNSSEQKQMDKCDPKKDEKKYEPEDKKSADKKPEDGVFEKAEAEQTRGAKQDVSDISEIKEMLAPLMDLIPMLPQLKELVQLMQEEMPEDGKDDLMSPADDKEAPEPKPSPDMEKGAPKPGEKDMAKQTEKPVEFSSMSSSTNGFIPSSTGKDKYQMTDNETLKYKKELEALKAENAATKKIAADLYKESRKAKAEKWVYDLESTHNIQYKSETEKNEDIEMLSQLDEDTAKVMLERMKVRYQRKLPDAAAVKDVAKYAVESEPDFTAKTPEEAHERAMAILKSGLTVDQFYAKLKDGVKK